MQLTAAQPFDYRRVAVMVTLGSLLGLVVLRVISYAMQPDAVMSLLTNADHRIYMDAAERIRSGGSLYPAFQFAPNTLAQMPELYPPPTVYLLIVPMSFLPAFLWWAIPLGIIAATVRYWRPSALGWVGILACFAPPWMWDGILSGGVAMWVAAAIALGTRWPAFYALAFAKPSLFPFPLLGVRSRWWWAAVGLAGIVSLLMIPAWLDYATVMGNLTDGSLLYSIHNVPLLLVPLIAWSGRLRT